MAKTTVWLCPLCEELTERDYCPRDGFHRPSSRREAPPSLPTYQPAPLDVFHGEVTWGDEALTQMGCYLPWPWWLALAVVVLAEVSSSLDTGEPPTRLLVVIGAAFVVALLAGILYRVRPAWVLALGRRLAPLLRPLWPRRIFRYEMEVEREGHGRTALFLDDPEPWPRMARRPARANQAGVGQPGQAPPDPAPGAGQAEQGAAAAARQPAPAANERQLAEGQDLLRGQWRFRARSVPYSWGRLADDPTGQAPGAEPLLPPGRSIRSASRAYYVERADPAPPSPESPAGSAPPQTPAPVFNRRTLGPVGPLAFLALYLALRAVGL